MINHRVILVGAGGFGREVLSWAQDSHEKGNFPKVFGFLDDNPIALNNFDYNIDFLGDIDSYQPREKDVFLLGVAIPSIKEKVIRILRSKGANFLTLIHPSAVVARSASIGEGVIVCPFALISADTKIGDYVTINAMSSIGHDTVIGNFSTLSGHVDVTGQVVVGDAVFFGTGAKIIPRIKIGSKAKIGAGCTVMRSVAPGVTVYTNPAKRLS